LITYSDRYGIPAFSGFAILGADLPNITQQTSVQETGTSSKVFAKPQQITRPTARQIKDIKSHMLYALFVTSCCFFPMGLAAIFSSKRCINAAKDKDFKLAQRFSAQTLHLSHATILIGIIVFVMFVTTLALYFFYVQKNTINSLFG
jgi:hypothetical protein